MCTAAYTHAVVYIVACLAALALAVLSTVLAMIFTVGAWLTSRVVAVESSLTQETLFGRACFAVRESVIAVYTRFALSIVFVITSIALGR